jgi:hypothetical protein
MESDAKLGLLAGIAGVVIIAVVYFQKDPAISPSTASPRAASVSGIAGTPIQPPSVPPAAFLVPSGTAVPHRQ